MSRPNKVKTGPQQMAALDLGSNSFHLLIAQESGGRVQVVDKHKEMVRLAEGLVEKGSLDPLVANRALASLDRFSQRLRPLDNKNIRVVATSAFRQLGIQSKFFVDAESTLGHPIEVISGREEARLIYLGVCHDLGDNSNRQLVVDIGGGSTELIIGQNYTAKTLESVHMGCVSWAREYFPGDRVDAKCLRRAISAAAVQLEPIAQNYLTRGWEYAIGASGTINSVSAVQEAMGLGSGITLASMKKIRDQILRAKSAYGLPGLSKERVEVFAAGLSILIAVFQILGIEKMDPAQTALREGVIYDLVGRKRREDVRDKTVSELMRRFSVDELQSGRVKQTALNFLKKVKSEWNLRGSSNTALLGWGADLHEIGMDVSHSSYHRHGGYLLSNLEMPGFSKSEQLQLATLVMLHRRKIRPEYFLDTSDNIIRLAVLLRLAALIHRGRNLKKTPEIVMRANFSRGQITLEMGFKPDWLKNNPLTQLDLLEDAELLRENRVLLRIVEI
ncbi:MAG: exopolyphosphatase [Gammaproteobacteria bacterium]|nr:exopolyphosphatase [Gammaproteobacteria bacterium]